jgi:hypothetical protein
VTTWLNPTRLIENGKGILQLHIINLLFRRFGYEVLIDWNLLNTIVVGLIPPLFLFP